MNMMNMIKITKVWNKTFGCLSQQVIQKYMILHNVREQVWFKIWDRSVSKTDEIKVDIENQVWQHIRKL